MTAVLLSSRLQFVKNKMALGEALLFIHAASYVCSFIEEPWVGGRVVVISPLKDCIALLLFCRRGCSCLPNYSNLLTFHHAKTTNPILGIYVTDQCKPGQNCGLGFKVFYNYRAETHSHSASFTLINEIECNHFLSTSQLCDT